MSRATELLKAAADALEAEYDPFHESFLTSHDVTLDECGALAGMLAVGARLIAWAMENPEQARAAAEGASTGLQLDALKQAMDKLKNLRTS